jgi:hypothetical protein
MLKLWHPVVSSRWFGVRVEHVDIDHPVWGENAAEAERSARCGSGLSTTFGFRFERVQLTPEYVAQEMEALAQQPIR